MTEADDTIRVEMPDSVRVHQITDGLTRKHGLLLGAWYVRYGDDADSLLHPKESRFIVGNNQTGLRIEPLGWNFHDAKRIALALDDAFPAFSLETLEEWDCSCIFESVVAAALMEHYVFPIDRYFASLAA